MVSAMPECARSSGELVRASQHLLYEFEMVGLTSRLLADFPPSDYWVKKTAYFALVESLLTHIRSLMSFFHPALVALSATSSRGTTYWTGTHQRSGKDSTKIATGSAGRSLT
jgi:hypothetical protein